MHHDGWDIWRATYFDVRNAAAPAVHKTIWLCINDTLGVFKFGSKLLARSMLIGLYKKMTSYTCLLYFSLLGVLFYFCRTEYCTCWIACRFL
jgi:hypothetical protein